MMLPSAYSGLKRKASECPFDKFRKFRYGLLSALAHQFLSLFDKYIGRESLDTVVLSNSLVVGFIHTQDIGFAFIFLTEFLYDSGHFRLLAGVEKYY